MAVANGGAEHASLLLAGEEVLVKGSAKDPYVLRPHNDGQYFSCSCPAWRNQGAPVDQRTCKHLTKELGAAFETARLGAVVVAAPASGPSKAPPLILAESWDGVTDPTGMLMSEKLDGVRAYWDGGQFLSRQGNTFYAPEWFTAGLPSTPLDGELWIGRGAFQKTVSTVRTGSGGRSWEEIAFVVFDAPMASGGFAARIAWLDQQHGSWGNERVQVLDHIACGGHDHLQSRLDEVEALGGEGLMLRERDSAYTSGRTSDLLKVKRFKDGEARVVAIEPGQGRHKGRAGALVCALADGTSFKVGTGLSDAQREAPPEIGAIITFRYQELTDAGVPRFPAFLRVRSDVSVLDDHAAESATPSTTTRAKQSQAITESTHTGAVARYEFVEGSSSKFWEIGVDAATVTTRWGRIGTNGQSSTKAYPSEAAAASAAAKQTDEKIAKGYEPTP